MSISRRILALALVPAVSAQAARPRVGEVVGISGEARALFGGDPARRLALGEPLLLGDLLSTDAGARLACRLLGGIMMQLGERSSLQVDALTLQGPRAGTAIRAFEGALLLDRPPQAGATPIAVNLPWARIGVRGTRFFAGGLDGAHAVFVARGRVVVEAGGSSAVLSEGEGIDVARPGAPLGPVVRWGQPRIARALALFS